jgi:sortase A
MIIVGLMLLLAGLGWGAWQGLNPPPPATITEAGAVVLAVTAQPATPQGGVTETQPPQPSPTRPTPTPSPSPSPTPTPMPPAKDPPTRVVAEAVEIDTQVVEMGWEEIEYKGEWFTKWVVPPGAAGWHVNSALPGHGDNVVISGHHNIKGKVFRYLVDLEPGDVVTVYAGDLPYTYTVTEKYILQEAGMPADVRRRNAQWIMPTGDERLTLVTCWPYNWPGNTHRVIVVARPIGPWEMSGVGEPWEPVSGYPEGPE